MKWYLILIPFCLLTLFSACKEEEKGNSSDSDEVSFAYSLNGLPTSAERTVCQEGSQDSCYFSFLPVNGGFDIDNIPEASLNATATIKFRVFCTLPGLSRDGLPKGECKGFCSLDTSNLKNAPVVSLDFPTSGDVDSTKVDFDVDIEIIPTGRTAKLGGGICILIETLDPISSFHPTIDSIGVPKLQLGKEEIIGQSNGNQPNLSCELSSCKK